MAQAAEQHADMQREIVAFLVAGQDFCIDIGHVREIRGWTPTTALPHAPSYIKGVMNLRGTVLPVIDLSDRLGLGVTDPSPRHVIVIALLGRRTVGLLVEAVSDIMSLPPADLKPTPDIASAEAKTFVQGVFTSQDRLIRVIELARVLPPEEGEAE